MIRSQRWGKVAVVAVLATATFAGGQTRKDFRFTVGAKSSVTVTNRYGAISVKPGFGNQVTVMATLQSGKVEIDPNQNGNRIELISHLLPGATAENARVDYELTVPADANVTLQSTTGPLHAEGLHGDVIAEGATATVDVRDVSNAHVHVKTLNGPITLTNINDGHVEITSVSGAIVLNDVNGAFVDVNSSSGTIRYDGDFGYDGEYTLRSYSGDINATAPVYASMDVTARSVKGQVENDFPLSPKTHSAFPIDAMRSLVGTAGKAASSVRLLSFSGKIHLKKRK
jgi:DUF4097 and DUF4098 domain-containing protein YvlB